MAKSRTRNISLPLYHDIERADRAADLLKAVAHPVRIRLAALLCERSHSVTDLANTLELKQAIVSQQLSILRRSRLVAATRVGGLAIYRVVEPHLADMIQCLDGCSLA
jgi:DNA-binding transcriptional ArsR family regulator